MDQLLVNLHSLGAYVDATKQLVRAQSGTTLPSLRAFCDYLRIWQPLVMERLSPLGSGDDIAKTGSASLLAQASATGSLADVVCRLADAPAHPPPDLNVALLFAAASGHAQIVQRLLAVAPVSDSFVLPCAILAGQSSVIDLLLSDDYRGVSLDESDALRCAALAGNAQVVTRLLLHPRVDVSRCGCEALSLAAFAGHLDVVGALLADERVDPRTDNFAAIVCASYCGHADVVTRLLLNTPLDATVKDTLRASFRLACMGGHAAIAELLAADFRADAAAQVGDVLVEACTAAVTHTHHDCLRWLLSSLDERAFHPCLSADLAAAAAAAAGPALLAACESANAEAVELLLTSSSVAAAAAAHGDAALKVAARLRLDTVAMQLLRLLPADSVSAATVEDNVLTAACRHGHAEIVECLLADERVDPARLSNISLCIAAECGHAAVVARLLADDRVDPEANDNFPLRKASHMGHLAVVERLLADSRMHQEPTGRWSAPLVCAAAKGHLAILNRLLDDPRTNFREAGTAALQAAVKGGFADVVSCLFAQERLRQVQIFDSDEVSLADVCADGHLAVVERLLDDLRWVPCQSDGDLSELGEAAAHNHLAVVERLLQHPETRLWYNRHDAVYAAAQGGHMTMLQRLLAEVDHRFRVQPIEDEPREARFRALCGACQGGHAGIIEWLLAESEVSLEDPDFRTSALACAAEAGHLAIVERFLAIPSTKPEAFFDDALTNAAEKGHTLIIDRLLADPRVGSPESLQTALEDACRGGHRDAAKRLLADPRALLATPPDLVGHDAWFPQGALSSACWAGLLDVVELILADPRSDTCTTADPGSCALLTALRSKQVNVFGRLLANPRVDPAPRQVALLKHSCCHGMLSIVNALLAHPRVTLADRGKACLLAAVERGHDLVVARLLQDPRVDPSADKSAALSIAVAAGHVPVLSLLLQDGRTDPIDSDCSPVRLAAERGSSGSFEALLEDDRVWARVRHGGSHSSHDDPSSGRFKLPLVMDARERLWTKPLSAAALHVLLQQLIADSELPAARAWRKQIAGATSARHIAGIAWARRRAAILGRWAALTADDE